MSEIKPCPLCGQEIYSEFYSNRAEEFDGHCTNKKCLLYGKDLLFFNTAKWNTRPIEDKLRRENEQMNIAISEIYAATYNESIANWKQIIRDIAEQALNEVTK